MEIELLRFSSITNMYIFFVLYFGSVQNLSNAKQPVRCVMETWYMRTSV